MTNITKNNKGHKYEPGGTFPTSVISTAVSLYNTTADLNYNYTDPLHEDKIFDEAARGTAQDMHFKNQLYNLITTGNGIWGESAAEREIREGMEHAKDINTDVFSKVQNNENLLNVYDINALPSDISYIKSYKDNGRSLNAAMAINPILQQKRQEYINNFYDQALSNQQRQQRQTMMNYFDEGGELNEFNVGGSHEDNPLGGIPQGIASDGLPNLVEEGEVRSDFDDAKIFNNQEKNYNITAEDCEKYKLPKSVIGCNPAEAIKKLKKEYEGRENDPISINTMKEWDSRVFAFQEDKTAELEEKQFTKEFNKLPNDIKIALAQDALAQEQQGIELGEPLYKKGGKLGIHINPKNRGKFNATKKRTGKTTEELTHSKNPLTRKRAIFAQNAKKWAHKHQVGGWNDVDSLYTDYNYNSPYQRLEIVEPESIQPLNLNTVPITEPTNPPVSFLDIYAASRPTTDIPYAEPEAEQEKGIVNKEETPREKAIKAAATPEGQQIAHDYWRSLHPDLYETPVKKFTKKDSKNPQLDLSNLRYAPAIGAQLGALTAALQPIDYTLSNDLNRLANRITPIGAPHIGGYRRYAPYDVNLGDAENLALLSAAINANRGQNRATQGALNVGLMNSYQRALAQRNLAAQQANETLAENLGKFNLGINQFNAQQGSTYDQLNSQRLMQRLAMEQSAAQAADASRTAWAANVNSTAENAFNQLGNIGRDAWNRNQRDILLEALGAEGIKELLKTAEGRAWLRSNGYNA